MRLRPLSVRARLTLLFGSEQRVTMTGEGDGMTVVTVTMPLVRKKGAAAA